MSLYDDALLERAKRPVGSGRLDAPDRRGRSDNPLCGDEIEVDVALADGTIAAVAHRTRGCALTMASASLLAETVPGRRVQDALGRAEGLRHWLAGEGTLPPGLEPLEVARMFPARARCVLVPWTALRQALASDDPG